VKLAMFLNGSRLLRDHQRESKLFWSDPRRRSAIVLLQDHAPHIGEAIDGCQKSLTTMHSVMLPRNPIPGTFP
jgi:hypothetical protein